MKVSPPVRHKPRALFEPPPRRIEGHGQVRTAVGRIVEELTEDILGVRRHVTSGKYPYCPDMSLPDGTLIECKSMGPQSSLCLYQGRIEKDLDLADLGHRLVYLVWHHEATFAGVQNDQDVRDRLLLGMRWCAAVPLGAIETMCLWKKPTKTSVGEYGGAAKRQKDYGTYYRIPKAEIEPWALFRWEIDDEELHASPAGTEETRMEPTG